MTMEKRRLFVIGTIGAGTVFGGPGGSETESVTIFFFFFVLNILFCESISTGHYVGI